MSSTITNKLIEGLVVVLMLVGVVSGCDVKQPPHGTSSQVKPTNHLEYVGSFTSTTNGDIETTSLYYMSLNATGHAISQSDCTAFLGEDSTLLYVETQEELGNITAELMKSDNTAASYWTGGKYNSSIGAFIWGNGVRFGPWTPWDEGHPSTQVPVTRVLLQYNGNVKFRTAFSTVNHRYICEIKIGPIKEETEPSSSGGHRSI